jgi:hypothetical protein
MPQLRIEVLKSEAYKHDIPTELLARFSLASPPVPLESEDHQDYFYYRPVRSNLRNRNHGERTSGEKKLSLQDRGQAMNGQAPLRIEIPAEDTGSYQQIAAWMAVGFQELKELLNRMCGEPIRFRDFRKLDDYFQGFYNRHGQTLAEVSHIFGEAIERHQLPQSYWGKTYAPHMPAYYWNSPKEYPAVQHIEYMNRDNAMAADPESSTASRLVDPTIMIEAGVSQRNLWANDQYEQQLEPNGVWHRLSDFYPGRPGYIFVRLFKAPQHPPMSIANLIHPSFTLVPIVYPNLTQPPAMNIANIIHHPAPAPNPAQAQTQLPSFASLLAQTSRMQQIRDGANRTGGNASTNTGNYQQAPESSPTSDDTATLEGSPDWSGNNCACWHLKSNGFNLSCPILDERPWSFELWKD